MAEEQPPAPSQGIEIYLNVYDVVPPDVGGGSGAAAPITRLNNVVRRRRRWRPKTAAVGVATAASGAQCGRGLPGCGPRGPHACGAPTCRRALAPSRSQTRHMFGGLGGIFHGAIVVGEAEWSFGYCVSRRDGKGEGERRHAALRPGGGGTSPRRARSAAPHCARRPASSTRRRGRGRGVAAVPQRRPAFSHPAAATATTPQRPPPVPVHPCCVCCACLSPLPPPAPVIWVKHDLIRRRTGPACTTSR
jgi:hypothetical protein